MSIHSDNMKSEFLRILLKNGFSEEKAAKCAEIFTVNSLEGIYSHGVNRFPRFVKSIRKGFIRPEAVPTLVHKSGSIEQWNGNLGPGPLNASCLTDRAMELAKESGIGLIGLANTNHWMRAGTYGWQAARKGFVFICWTNTCANMPTWGATDTRLGNNPFVIAIPYGNEAIVLDFAMSQFSYGKMESYRNDGRQLPYPGGYNNHGELTTDPGEVLETWRALPAGYWKGAGFSLLLDILATILAGGLSTHDIGRCETESGLSQVFIAININNLKNFPAINNTIDQIIEDFKKSKPENKSVKIRYPGENAVETRLANQKNGIPVHRSIWEKILSL
ncbi:MAG: 3-dehydro-L-gulonate 2-dehydrogenase [Bacteroidetes bacterium]|nr:MAG: 3-dehydro-L-gulonate 2-dehydrogenase [Bacteroidota bacterium]